MLGLNIISTGNVHLLATGIMNTRLLPQRSATCHPTHLELRNASDLTVLPIITTDSAYLSAEHDILNHLDQSLPPHTQLHISLIGPGASKSDPLYARRLLQAWGRQRQTPGRLDIYEIAPQELLPQYLAAIDWGTHKVALHSGSAGDFRRAQNARAHLMIMIHPIFVFTEIEDLAYQHLVAGGILLCQEEYRESSDVEAGSHLEGILRHMKGRFELARPVYPGPLMTSYFSQRFNHIHTLVLQRTP